MRHFFFRQIALADIIVINKTDLVEKDMITSLENTIRYLVLIIILFFIILVCFFQNYYTLNFYSFYLLIKILLIDINL